MLSLLLCSLFDGAFMSLRFQQKLIIPATARPLVDRPRLLSELEQVVTTRRVVALAAPAGWGKTTTLAQWAAGSRLPVAWYTLDPADRDPQLFLDYLLDSVAQYAGNCHLVLASRTLPTLHGLVRMVAQQRAAVFDYAALQFSVAEIQQLAGMSYALTLSDESAGQLVNQLGGWVTGIV